EIARLIGELTGRLLAPIHLPTRPHDVLRLCGDPSRLRQILGESPQISIRDGLARTVAWFRANVTITQELLASLEPKNWEAIVPEPWLHTVMARRSRSATAA